MSFHILSLVFFWENFCFPFLCCPFLLNPSYILEINFKNSIFCKYIFQVCALSLTFLKLYEVSKLEHCQIYYYSPLTSVSFHTMFYKILLTTNVMNMYYYIFFLEYILFFTFTSLCKWSLFLCKMPGNDFSSADRYLFQHQFIFTKALLSVQSGSEPAENLRPFITSLTTSFGLISHHALLQ